ncbi:hypothetical protein GCM10008023_41790 [Sphingomonas glacialis]|uniref:Metallophosphoesterase n=1 Tax=Sphingomonas glacialis TaxID=658225 RepID=A0ABQ3LUW6_9SPHN|nr:hypothetical protein GCM10008023_41790 [Sphingomonas glacialis]
MPGNHDIPFYDVIRRFAAPLQRYRHYIDDALRPWFENGEIAVLGLNTARSFRFKDGRINQDQISLLRQRFGSVAPSKTRILVTHHPLFAMPIGSGNELSEAVGRREEAVQAVCEAGVHVALAGHFHRTYAEAARKMVERSGRSLVIQAGTATSTRLRNEEPQSFNWIQTSSPGEIGLQVIVWLDGEFTPKSHVGYRFLDDGWIRSEIADAVDTKKHGLETHGPPRPSTDAMA